MRVLNILNSIILEVTRNENNYYLFLDSGFPISFSNDFDLLNSDDLGINTDFELNLNNPPINLTNLSEIFGIHLSGILGNNFFKKFNNLLIDINGKKLEFNLDRFKYDFETDLLNNNPFIIKLSVRDEDNDKLCLVDTGSFQCMNFSNDFSNSFLSSNGWVFPSAMGPMNINYYSNIDIFINNQNRGKYIFGIPTNLNSMPFSYVLGLNFLADYICLVDLENNKLKFKKSDKLNILNTKPLYSLKFQIIIKNKRIFVSNKLEGCNLGLKVGDEIIIPGIDMNNPEVINEIYNKIIFINSDKEIDLIHNGNLVKFKPSRLFT